MNSSEFIQQHCLTTRGTLNNRVTLKSWWVNKSYMNIYDQIFADTSWLPLDAPFTERLYCIVHHIAQRPDCQVCQHHNALFVSYANGYGRYCSRTCSIQCPERRRKISQHHDYVAVKEKMRQTNLLKYGTEWTTQTASMKDKTKETKQHRYGSATYNNTDQAQQTNLSRYGTRWTAQSPLVKEKIEAAKHKRHPELRDPQWLQTQNHTKTITEIAQELGVTYRAVYLRFLAYNIPMNFFQPKYSGAQKEVVTFIRSLGIDQIRINDRTQIAPQELDIYLPEYQLAIEYNGAYWHAEDPVRHLEKLQRCEAQHIRLIQIWDHEWRTQRDIVESIIRTAVHKNDTLYARSCTCRSLSSQEYRDFLTRHHLQGPVGSSIRYGLMHQDQLVAVIGIGKSRFNAHHPYELLRFCTRSGLTVVGGFSKLLRHCLATHTLPSLISYCDIRVFSGTLYERNGFRFSHRSTPGYFYYKSGMIRSRHEFQKHKLSQILPDVDPLLSEHENCNRNGWLRVYDCGQNVYYYEP